MKLIKTAADHAAALEELEALMIANPPPGSEESDEIELLGFLIETYEKQHHDIPPPHPVEAIRFAMEQQVLKQVDLVPFIGSKSRVSEILAGKRELTLNMVRELHRGLGIPLKSLVNDPDFELPEQIDIEAFPVKEMHANNYFKEAVGKKWTDVRDLAEEMLQRFFDGRQDEPIGALNRQTTPTKSKVDEKALHAWKCRVLDVAGDLKLPKYNPSSLNKALISQLTALSTLPTGPILVRDRLREVGIALIIEERLPKTLLDGAAMLHPNGFPVIALTLRYDRLDNFWFTLFHELGHVVLHLKNGETSFLDADIDSQSIKAVEKEADEFALNSFISPDNWESIRLLTTAPQIKKAAGKLAIHPAILAGRLRREARDYRKHRKLIGQGEVQVLFDCF